MAKHTEDLKGFDRQVGAVREMLKRVGRAYAFYENGRGFVFRKQISCDTEIKMNSGVMELIGYYEKPFTAQHLIEDLMFHLNSIEEPLNV